MILQQPVPRLDLEGHNESGWIEMNDDVMIATGLGGIVARDESHPG